MNEPGKCDFCSTQSPRWYYPAADFETLGVVASQGEWWACDSCAALIEANDRESLAVRCVDRLLVVHPNLVPERDWCLAMARIVHVDFWKNRTGHVRAEVTS